MALVNMDGDNSRFCKKKNINISREAGHTNIRCMKGRGLNTRNVKRVKQLTRSRFIFKAANPHIVSRVEAHK